MNGNLVLYIDQYGWRIWARSRKFLVDHVGGGRVSKMYRTRNDGTTVHIGYVVGPHWFEAFRPVENPV